MQATQRSDAFGARPQHQMIGIAKNDIGAGVADLAPMDCLHRACVATGMKAGVLTTP